MLTGDAALRHLVAAADGPDDALADRLVTAAGDNLARGDAHAAADLTLNASRLTSVGEKSEERLLDAVNLYLIDGDLATAKSLGPALSATSPTARRMYLQARLAWFAGEPDAAESLATEAWSRGDQLSPDHLGSLAAILSQLHNMRADGLGAAEWAARALELGLPPDLADSTNAAQAFGLGLVGRLEDALGVLASVPSDPMLVRGYGHQLTARGALRVAADDLVGARGDLATVCNASHAEVSPATVGRDGRVGRGRLPPRFLGRLPCGGRARTVPGRGHRAGVGPGIPAHRGRARLRGPRRRTPG